MHWAFNGRFNACRLFSFLFRMFAIQCAGTGRSVHQPSIDPALQRYVPAESRILSSAGYETAFDQTTAEQGSAEMLVLSRKISDVIVVGSSGANLGEVRIVVLGVNNGRVKLGIEAPPGVSVHREEVTLRSRMTESLEKVL